MKARGDGLGFDLGRVEFELAAFTNLLLEKATARVDGKALHRCTVLLLVHCVAAMKAYHDQDVHWLYTPMYILYM